MRNVGSIDRSTLFSQRFVIVRIGAWYEEDMRMLPVHRRVQVVIYLLDVTLSGDVVERSVVGNHRPARSNQVPNAQ